MTDANVTGVGGGHGLARANTMGGFVGGGDVGRGYMMSGKCWLQSVFSNSMVRLRAFNTFAQLDEDEWEEQVVEIYPAGGAVEQWTAFLVNNMVGDHLESKSEVLVYFAAALKIMLRNWTLAHTQCSCLYSDQNK